MFGGREILAEFKFRDQIPTMAEADVGVRISRAMCNDFVFGGATLSAAPSGGSAFHEPGVEARLVNFTPR